MLHPYQQKKTKQSKDMIELNKIYNEDCLEGMKRIPDGSVDCIICDLPYGTIKNLNLKGWETSTTKWDVVIDTKQLFAEYERVLRKNGVAVLFSQEPYTSHLRTFKATNLDFSYPLSINDFLPDPILPFTIVILIYL